jgi:hypothetical protein
VELDLENGVYKLLITPNSNLDYVGEYLITVAVTDNDFWKSGAV